VIAEILFWIYGAALICGTVILLWRYPTVSPHLRILLPLFLLTAGVEIPARYFVAHPNHWLYNLYLPVEFLLFTALYYFAFTTPRIKRIVLTGSVLLVLFAVWNMIAGQGFYSFNTYTVLVSGLLILTWIFFYFRELLRRSEYVTLTREPMFWISSGMLVFYLGNVFVAGTINYFIAENRNIAVLLLQVIKVLNILMFASFIVALLCPPPRTRS
jgi:hypothetical protein